MNWTTLVSTDELSAALGSSDLLVFDCRFALTDAGRGEREYAAGHIPGALFAHLDRDQSDLSKQGLGRHPLPDVDAFSAFLSRSGFRPGMQVVTYDDDSGAFAARLWWLLRIAGLPRVALLDGGFKAWRAAGLPITTAIPQRSPTQVSVHFDAAQIANYAEVGARLAAGSATLLDARNAPRFRGEVEPIDPVAGRVPGAVNRPMGDNVGADGRFKSPVELRDEFRNLLGNRDPHDVLLMCGSGVTACHNLLAMEHAGLVGARVFAASWSGWISDPSRPVARG